MKAVGAAIIIISSVTINPYNKHYKRKIPRASSRLTVTMSLR
jgi:hypothetical protein